VILPAFVVIRTSLTVVETSANGGKESLRTEVAEWLMTADEISWNVSIGAYGG
jgi:hypothetical protein